MSTTDLNTTEPNKNQDTTKFDELGLAEPLLRVTQSLGYETATPIQAASIPVILSGADLIGCAQTGTGKTAAFTLPTLQRLMESTPPAPEPAKPRPKHARKQYPAPRAIRALILSPTRELAAQIEASLQRYGKFTPLDQTVIYGGVSQFHQVKALRRGVDTLIATPGRLLDLVNQGHVDLKNVEVLIFDEADQMLDMGFLPDLKRIVKLVPAERQTLMFSATMPTAIRELAQQWLTKPRSIQVAAIAQPADRIKQSVHLVDKKKKPDLLSRFLHETEHSRTLVFSRTKHGADKIVKRLQKDGHEAAAIHGNKTQGARSRALERFKGKRPPVLVATDIAARGLDINSVSHVINYDLPETPETYVHRIGRTARAGASGAAVSFCAGDERGLLKQIERLMKQAIEVEPAIKGFEPTDPVTPAKSPRKGGGGGGSNRHGSRGGGGGGARNYGSTAKKSGGKPGAKRYGAKSGATSGATSGAKSGATSGANSGAKSAGKPSNKSSSHSNSGEGTSTGEARRTKPKRTKGSTAPPAGYKSKKKGPSRAL